jgi:hypothetical protein
MHVKPIAGVDVGLHALQMVENSDRQNFLSSFLGEITDPHDILGLRRRSLVLQQTDLDRVKATGVTGY